ncbi:uncharacterized protein (DUF58 family) [Pseudomonas duriflava]|uniref:Uncharacterized protein (DUF58 family) n=1 Tax=Pseudomonas duriflava TaxID=459528 RepID=A0A562QQQ3_9PSED|nr:DUF58 domain-containing protein [Pseudomonas duriflava]TWI58530.1 uncharacterized protein (DUF58 family) [Pseudomonas duriflava]
MKPSRRFLIMLVVLLACAMLLGTLKALAVALPEHLHTAWWGLGLALLVAAAIDALLAYRQKPLRIERYLPGQLPLGRWSDIELKVHHAFPHEVLIELYDHVPCGMEQDALPLKVLLKPGLTTQTHYRIRPLQRGAFIYPHCEVLTPSPFTLWQRRQRLELHSETRVYPDFARLYDSTPLAAEQWLGQLGVRQKPRRGLGQDFHQLREFREGDTLRQIDWKATARKGVPIAREYQEERDQQILFLLDCSRHMRSQDGELTHFDQALDACLLLAHVALRQGDAVGLSTFAEESPRHVAPGKGNRQLGVLLNTVYDLQPTLAPPDYSSAVRLLLTRQRRRALIVLVTNLKDENDETLRLALDRLGTHHRVLIASLREEILDTLVERDVHTYEEALAYCGAVDYRNDRQTLHERLGHTGLTLIDALPGELGPALVTRYLGWKKAGVL